MFTLLVGLFVRGLAVQFAGEKAWALLANPYAKVTVIARGAVDPDVVAAHVAEMKTAVKNTFNYRPALEERDGDVLVEIRRVLCEDDHEASISTSVIMAMTIEGAVY